MFLKQPTIMDRIFEVDKKNFQTDYVFNNRTQISDNCFVDGNILYKIPIKRSSIQDLIKNHRFPVTDKNATFHRDIHVKKEVTSKIIDVKLNADFKTCLEYIQKLRSKAGNNLYGVLLRSTSNKKVIINPLHPLTALSVLNDKSFNENMKFNLLAYFYPNRQTLDQQLNSSFADIESINKNLDALLTTFSNKLATEVLIDSTEPINNGMEYQIIYRTKKHPDEEKDNDYYVVVHQLVTKGIICPYYGTSLIKKPENGVSAGMPLSPLKSANISTGANIEDVYYGSVCTGSLSNKTMEGLRTLSHSNLSSAFCSHNFLDGSLIYIDACINKAFQIYTRSGFLDMGSSIIPIEIPKLELFTPEELSCKTPKEFRELHRELPMAEFVKLFKQLREVQYEQKNQQNYESEPETEPEPETETNSQEDTAPVPF